LILRDDIRAFIEVHLGLQHLLDRGSFGRYDGSVFLWVIRKRFVERIYLFQLCNIEFHDSDDISFTQCVVCPACMLMYVCG
jgi:hypothetical protein